MMDLLFHLTGNATTYLVAALAFYFLYSSLLAEISELQNITDIIPFKKSAALMYNNTLQQNR
jgi:hypothetical protein